MRFKLLPLLLAGLLAVAAFAAEDDEVVAGPIAPTQPDQMQQFGMANFDQMLFQNDGNATLGEQRMRTRVELQLADLDRSCSLSDAQKQKVQLAIRGDVQRFLSEAAVLRLKFDKLTKNQKLNDPNAFNEVWQQMWQDLQPLHNRLNMGLTEGSSSLLVKVLPKTLTTDQLRQYEKVTAERRQFRYEANIAVCLHNLEEVVFLSESQRETLGKLLLAMPAPRQSGQYEMYVVLCRIAAIPAEKLEPLFRPEQWNSLKAYRDQYRAVRENWIQAGILDPEDFPDPAVQEKP